jgi:hypothetical protein
MRKREFSKEFKDLLKRVEGKRSKVVVEHILEHGMITTEDLEAQYGYKHPPRAARDVREQGIPLKTTYVTNSEGKRIAAYIFGELGEVRKGHIGGRKVIPKKLKAELIDAFGSKCFICSLGLEGNALQVDHRVPYEVTGDLEESEWVSKDFMLLCVSCQRAKSWSCEHCINWNETRNPEICSVCYWASPENYKHIALREIRRLDIVWTEEEIRTYEELERLSKAQNAEMPEYVKKIIRNHVRTSGY